MAVHLQMKINPKLFLRDPQQTELGRNIISHSICLIDKLGFEEFTFKKLAVEMKSTEASIYRYFENKHNLLVYLVSWYWGWIEYQIEINTINISSAKERLRISLHIIAESTKNDPLTDLDEGLLHDIVVAESTKVYLTKSVDVENREGYFMNYKSVCKKLSEIIREVKPAYVYPQSLASTLVETAHKQVFFAKHLPSLTELKDDSKINKKLASYLEEFVSSILHIRF